MQTAFTHTLIPAVIAACLLCWAAVPAYAKTIDQSTLPELQNCIDCPAAPAQDGFDLLKEPSVLERLKDDAPPSMLAASDLRACLVKRLTASDVKFSRQDDGWEMSTILRNDLGFGVTAVTVTLTAAQLPKSSGPFSRFINLEERLNPNTSQDIKVQSPFELDALAEDSFEAELLVTDVTDQNGSTLINDFTLSSLATFDEAAFDRLKRKLCLQP